MISSSSSSSSNTRDGDSEKMTTETADMMGEESDYDDEDEQYDYDEDENEDDEYDDVLEYKDRGTEDSEESVASSSLAATKPTRRYVTGVVSKNVPLNEAVSKLVNCTFDEANQLIAIGAVWARMEALTEQDLLALYEDGNDMSGNSRAVYADLGDTKNNNINNISSTKKKKSKKLKQNEDTQEKNELEDYVEKMQKQRFRRILTPGRIEAGTDLRVYPQPRRFPACYEMRAGDTNTNSGGNKNKRSSLIYQDTTFVVVDKPAMCPTQPDASNYYECCPACAQAILGPFEDINGNTIERPLLCHRVDTCVSGCVVLSKDANGQRVFHELQRERRLRKVYKAVTTNPVPTGLHIQWMWAPQSARGKTGGPAAQLIQYAPPASRRKARQFWNRCVLEVVQCEPITIPTSSRVSKIYQPQDPQQQHYQSTVRLVTGRKHQVRAQLASLGCPIINDTLYQPLAGLTLDQLGVMMQDEEDNEVNVLDKALAQCRVPTKPIGLQAAAILFAGIVAKAGAPWWDHQDDDDDDNYAIQHQAHSQEVGDSS